MPAEESAGPAKADGMPPVFDPARKEEFERFRAQMLAQKQLRDRMGRIKHKIVVMSGKGGVGKTTVAVNLAMALTLKGKQVGLLDMDLTGPDVAKMLGVEGQRLSADDQGEYIYPLRVEPGLKVVSIALILSATDQAIVWRGPIKMGVIQQFLGKTEWGDLDYLIIDLPPGTSDEPLSVAQSIPDADGAVIVTQPQEVSLLDVTKSISFAKSVKLNVIGIVENMSGLVCPHCRKDIDIFSSGGGDLAAKKYGLPLLGHIPMDPRVVKCGDHGRPFVGDLRGEPVAKAFDEIVTKLEEEIAKKESKKPGTAAATARASGGNLPWEQHDARAQEQGKDHAGHDHGGHEGHGH